MAEPQPSGSVVFETTHGPLSIELWCKECPFTCRFFLALCLDGFYNNLPFHRIIPNFLIQTGDAHFRQHEKEGNNDANDVSENAKVHPWRQPPPKKYRQKHQAFQALERRQYEINSRIRFNHRGLIAMALGIDDNDDDDDDENNNSKSLSKLQPQFFITLEEASHLDFKHVCFGRISGPTIFNALRIGQTDIFKSSNEDDIRNFQPRILSEAPRILRTKIMDVDLPPTLPALAPTQDMSLLPWKIDPSTTLTSKAKDVKKRKKKNRKGVKNINLLSFGEEMNDDEANDDNEAKGAAKRIQSSHDILASKSLSKKKTEIISDDALIQSEQDKDMPAVKNQESKTENEMVKQSRDDNSNPKDTSDSTDPNVPTFSFRKDRIATEQNKGNIVATTDTNTTIHSNSGGHSVGETKKKDRPKKISLVEARRAKYAKKNSNRKGSNKQQREDDTMAKFKAFQQKMAAATTGGSGANQNGNSMDTTTTYHGQILEGDTDSRDWINTKFKCKKHMDQDAKARGGDGRGIEDYKVVEERSSATERKPGKRRRH